MVLRGCLGGGGGHVCHICHEPAFQLLTYHPAFHLILVLRVCLTGLTLVGRWLEHTAVGSVKYPVPSALRKPSRWLAASGLAGVDIRKQCQPL